MSYMNSTKKPPRKRIGCTPVAISLHEARHIALLQQALHSQPKTPPQKQSISKLIQEVGMIQLDAINIVERSHYLVLFSRLGYYRRRDFDELVWPNQTITEQWAHAASIIPSQDFKYFAPAIKAQNSSIATPRRLKKIGNKPKQVLKLVMREITQRGALRARDFKQYKRSSHTWWNRSPIREALHLLFRQGVLYIKERIDFEPTYDLIDRHPILSKSDDKITLRDWLHWSTLRAISCLGIGTAEHIADYYRQRTSTIRTIIEQLVQENVVSMASVESWHQPAYLLSENLQKLSHTTHPPDVTTFLSPFDNFLWHRGRIKDLFGFDYKAEMYTPPTQRKYGYYIMPILCRGQLVGRAEPKLDRTNNTLVLRNILLERSELMTSTLVNDIHEALKKLMIFLNCEQLVIERCEPSRLKDALLC